MLLQLQAYMKQRRFASMLQLCKEFNTQAEVMRDMLSLWARKGRICEQAKPPGCGQRCVQCDPLAIEVYRWTGDHDGRRGQA